MGRIAATMPSFCLNKIKTHPRVRPPPLSAKNSSVDSARTAVDECDHRKSDDATNNGQADSGDSTKPVGRRRIMIVVDSSIEAKHAVHWALTHTVQSHDLVFLLHVTKSCTSKQGDESSRELTPGLSQYLSSMKNLCMLKRPEVEVEIAVAAGGKEKGAAIVEEARKRGVGLLVLGQKKRSTTWRLLMMWGGRGHRSVKIGVVDYCIQNATCMAIAVRRKSNKLGGYLITTKRHKDFWLLA